MENVCLGVDDDSHMYAVGSKAHTDLLDARTLQVINFTLLESIISIYFEIGFKNVELQPNWILLTGNQKNTISEQRLWNTISVF